MKHRLLKLLAAVSTGCLLFLACADFDIWPLAWFAFIPLLVAVRNLPRRQAFLWGWLAGIVANGGGFYWITHLLLRFGHLPLWLALILFLLLAAYQGIHFGFFLYLIRLIQDRAFALPMMLLAPVTMTALELLMPFIFPWYLAITQAWIIPIIQVADLTGPLGVTFLLMLVNGLLFDGIKARLDGGPWPWRSLASGAAVLILALSYGFVRQAQYNTRWQDGPKIKVGLVQANIGIVEKGRAALAQKHLQLHRQESQQLISEGAQLIVWPESSYPYAFERSMQRDWPPGHPYQVMQDITVPLLFGVLTYGRHDPYPYNSAYMMEPDGRITGRFDKNYLLIFGEYIPFYEQFPSFRRYFPAAAHFAHGHDVTTLPFGPYKLGPLICYEDIMPSFGRRLAPLKPHLLVNITNDAWFGQTSEPYEHLALSVFRAVELRVGLVRAVNTGISAFIDATGRVIQQSQPHDPVITPGIPPESLLGEVTMLPGGETVYAAIGDLFGYLNLLALAGLVIWSRRSGGHRRADQTMEPEPPSKKRRPKRSKM